MAAIYEYQIFDRTKSICNYCVLLKGHFSIFSLVKEISLQMHTLCNENVKRLTKTCQTFSLAPSKEQNRMLTPVREKN